MNIQELIKARFLKQKNSQAHLYAIIHRSLIESIQEELGIDISEYIESIKLHESKIYVKTNSSLVSEEIQNISGKLEGLMKEKLENLGKKYKTLDIIVK